MKIYLLLLVIWIVPVSVPQELRNWMDEKMPLNKQRAEEIAPQEKADT